MRLSSFRAGLLVIVVSAAGLGAVVFAQAGQAGRAGAQAKPQNLQVLPKDWTLEQVRQQMRGFAGALGVECIHCHIGPMADRWKDDNPKKGIARKMIVMTKNINDDMLKGIGEPAAAGAAKITCYSCHRGAIKPLNAPGGGGH